MIAPTESGRHERIRRAPVIIVPALAVGNLAAINNADIGVITAGMLRNTGNTAGVNLGGAGGIPGTWTAGINFEAGDGPSPRCASARVGEEVEGAGTEARRHDRGAEPSRPSRKGDAVTGPPEFKAPA